MIFEIDKKKVEIPASEVKWIALGVEFNAAKKKGISGVKFAEEKNINYNTFLTNLSKYRSKIHLAIKAETLKAKDPTALTRKERAVLMINTYRASLRQSVKNAGASINNKSLKWFNNTISTLRSHKVTRPYPGKMYAFAYDAKHKDTLPFWDKYPLIIYLGEGRVGTTRLMYGLNLHYIPVKARQQLLEDLLVQYSSTNTLSNNTRLKVRWEQVKGFKGADKMIKAYLPGHFKSAMAEIKPQDWANATMMPLQQFVSGGKRHAASKVWK